MFVPPQHDRFLITAILAAGCVVTGLGFTLFGPRRWGGRAANVAAGVGVSGTGFWLFLPEYLLMTVIGGTVLTAVAGVGVGRLTRWVGACLRPFARPRVGGAVLASLAAAAGVLSSLRYDDEIETEGELAWAELSEWSSPRTTEADTALTDGCSPVPLHLPVNPWSAEEATRRERNSAVINEYSDKWIRRGGPTDNSNCHGWVFAGGRYNVGGQQVPTILRDNSYEPVSSPEAGDLCIYRDTNDIVSHSSVVRAVLEDGTVLVEGKWGRLGVYLHPVGDSCYGDRFTYYRSDRGGHLLQGVDADPNQ
jgi:hypothetical protein